MIFSYMHAAVMLKIKSVNGKQAASFRYLNTKRNEAVTLNKKFLEGWNR